MQTKTTGQSETSGYRILLVDDEPNILIALQRVFFQENYVIVTAANGTEALDLLHKEPFHLMISDYRMPAMNGAELLKQAKEINPDMIRIMLTAYADTGAVMDAINEGAVYKFILKPWEDDHLRVTVALALEQQDLSLQRLAKPPPLIRFGAYEVDEDRRTIAVAGKSVELTQKEYELACYMLQRPGKLLSRVHLLEKLWGLNAEVDTRTVDTHVSRIRRKLGIGPEHGWQIFSVSGWGYRIEKVDNALDSAKISV